MAAARNTGVWSEDTYETAPPPGTDSMTPPTAAAAGADEDASEMSLGEATKPPETAPGTAPAEGSDMQDDDAAQVGKRVTSVDAETDRMARLFLGKEDEEQAKLRLKIVQSNPNSHLSSAKTFDEMGLPPALLKGVQSLGFEKPSAIQEMALPMCLRNPPENLLAQAQSGSGKTAAFCLAGLCRIETRLAMPQMLIVTPTRELAVQCVQETLLPMAKFMEPPLQVFSALKGIPPPRAGVRAHVVVGTPGSIVGALEKRKLLLTHCAVFVLDEADAMLEDSGDSTQHRNKCILIKQRYLPVGKHQTLLFSATFPREVKQFGLELAESPVNEISLPDEQDLVLDVITQLWIDLRQTRQSRLELIQELYEVLEMGQSIIFCGTKKDADMINEKLQEQGFTCSILHSRLEGEERDATMEQFRLGHNKVLLTTNVLSRGVDVPAVSLVVNYDMPTMGYSREADPDTYLHRIGRTGRFGRRGVAINLVQDDAAFQVLQEIDRHFSPNASMVRHASPDVEELEKIIVEESKKRVENRDLAVGPN
ncbi:unnamed protein product [Scytosiphon promiscuus]